MKNQKPDLIEMIEAYLRADKSNIEILKTIKKLLNKLKANKEAYHDMFPFILKTRSFTNDSFVRFVCDEIITDYQTYCMSKDIHVVIHF